MRGVTQSQATQRGISNNAKGGNGNLQIIVSPGDRFDVVSASSGSILGYATHYIWSGDVFLKKGKFQPSSS
jgi:hypothetical protein